jgi:hypothetical protein
MDSTEDPDSSGPMLYEVSNLLGREKFIADLDSVFAQDDEAFEHEMVDLVNRGEAAIEVIRTMGYVQNDTQPTNATTNTDIEESTSAATEWAEKRTKVNEYFTQQLESRKWTLLQDMPRKGREAHFDKFLVDLGVQTNRTWASRQWRLFKLNKGVLPPPKFSMDSEQLSSEYSSRLTDNTIVADALSAVKNVKLCPEIFQLNTQSQLLQLSQSETICSLINSQIPRLTQALAKNLAGATVSSLDKRVTNFELAWQDMRNRFVLQIEKYLGSLDGPIFSRPQIRIFFGHLYKEIILKWRLTIRSKHYPDLITNLGESEVQTALQGSRDIVFYVAGALLHRLLRIPQNQERTKTIASFVAFNSTTNVDSDDSTASVVQKREVHKGKLTRPATSWSKFCELLEALYIVNLTAANALQFRGRLVQTIYEKTKRSLALQEAFSECITGSFDKNQRATMWHMYLVHILPWYCKLKAGDFLKSIKAKTRRSGDGSVSLRKGVLTSSKKD